VRLGQEGLVPGRISIRGADGKPQVVNNVKVHFVKNGKAVAVVTPGINGVFQAEGITPGEYAVVAAGPEVFTAYTVHVVAGDTVSAESLDATLQLQSQGIPAQDFPVVNSMVNSLVTSDFCSRFCNAPLSGPMVPTPELGTIIDNNVIPSPDGPFNALPIESPPLERFPDSPVNETSVKTDKGYKHVSYVDESGENEPVAPFDTQSVRLQASGQISGRIHWTNSTAPHQQPAVNAKVAFIRNGEVHQIAVTDDNGHYEVSGLSEGSYSVFAACQSDQCARGCCSAFSVDCLPYVENVVDDYPAQFDCCLVGCENMDYTLETMCGCICGTVESAPTVDCCGTAAGYGGGAVGAVGYGGGGGGFFGGSLLGLAGVGLGVAAIVDNDDGNNIIIGSPSKP
jgi:hypothetical protein